jgi:HK97 family phage major capsid protein
MANPILEKIDEFGFAVEAMRKANDESLAEMKKGNEARAKELEIQSERANRKIDVALKVISQLNKENEEKTTRIELLEALADRPKGTPSEQLEQKYNQVWVKHFRTGMQDNQLAQELKSLGKQVMETKVDSVLSQTALNGGNGVPRIISDAIEKLELAQSDILREVNVVRAGSPDYNELVTIAGTNGGWATETGSRSQSNAPNLRKVTITHGDLYAFPRASNWSLEDLMFDVVGWLTTDVADTFAISVSTAIHSGDGSSKPTGMVNTAPTNVDDYGSPMRAAAVYEYIATGSSPIATAPTIDDLIDVQTGLRRPYQPNAKWTMNSVTMGSLRKLKETATGAYVWQPSTQLGTPDLLLGKPVFVWEDMAAYAGSALPIAYGDFRRAYTYANIGGMSMIRDNVTVPGFTNFLVSQRAGGIPRNNNAVKFLKQIAS